MLLKKKLRKNGLIKSEDDFDLKFVLNNLLSDDFDPNFLNLDLVGSEEDDAKSVVAAANDQPFMITSDEFSKYFYFEYEKFYLNQAKPEFSGIIYKITIYMKIS